MEASCLVYGPIIALVVAGLLKVKVIRKPKTWAFLSSLAVVVFPYVKSWGLSAAWQVGVTLALCTVVTFAVQVAAYEVGKSTLRELGIIQKKEKVA